MNLIARVSLNNEDLGLGFYGGDNAMNLIARVSLNNEDLGLGFYAVIARPGLGHNHLGLLSSPQLAA